MIRHPLARALGTIAGYLVFIKTLHILVINFIAYALVRSSGSEGSSALQRMSEVMRSNQALAFGVTAFLFIAFLHVLRPLTRTRLNHVFAMSLLKGHFTHNAINGIVFTVVLVTGTALSGYMSYLGIYMRFDEVVFSFVSAAIFAVSLFVLVLVEEYLMRRVLETQLSENYGPAGVAVASCVVYLLIKWSQFELSPILAMNLILLNLTLSKIARAEQNFMASTSFAATFMILTHSLFSLPFMGQDMPRILSMRAASQSRTGEWLSGGANGPESGLIFTLLLVLYLYLPVLRAKKIEA